MGLRIEEVDELDGTGSENLWTERDTKVAGLFNRETRTITLTKSESPVQRRFTLAHEFAHAIYHCDPLHLRQRVARASSGNPKAHLAGRIKDPEERKADIFAAELLMPMEFVTKATIQRFGASIDMTVPRDDLAHYLSSATKRKIEPRRLAEMPQYDRALLFTGIKSFHGKEFVPLVELFDVSVEAMAIRLLELGLVN